VFPRRWRRIRQSTKSNQNFTLARPTIMVYSTDISKRDTAKFLRSRTNRPPPGVFSFVPGRDIRHRSGIQQHRGVGCRPGRGPAPQGSAVRSLLSENFGPPNRGTTSTSRKLLARRLPASHHGIRKVAEILVKGDKSGGYRNAPIRRSIRSRVPDAVSAQRHADPQSRDLY